VLVFNAASANSKSGDNYMTYNVGSYHPGGINAAYCDGSVHFVKDSITSSVLRSAGRIADGGPVGGIE
jgi:prepilin-type processing-associated H-X9-DG protein